MSDRGIKVFPRGKKYIDNFDSIFCKRLHAEVGDGECTPSKACEECMKRGETNHGSDSESK
jgi:hypothetical protein